jgi:hypothetical protein
MSTQQDHYKELVKLLLPEEIFDYFEITNMVVQDRSVSVFLDERDIKPVAFSGKPFFSKVQFFYFLAGISFTGKLTELEIKHNSCALLCNASSSLPEWGF